MYGAATAVNGGAASGHLAVQQPHHQKTYSMHESEAAQRAMNIVSSTDMDSNVKDIDVMMDGDMDDITGATTTMDITTEAHKRDQQRLL